jgi:hypothetical protein
MQMDIPSECRQQLQTEQSKRNKEAGGNQTTNTLIYMSALETSSG